MAYVEVYCPASVKKQLAKEFEESLRITVPDEPDVVPSIDPCAANKAGIKFADYQCNNAMGLFAKMKGKQTGFRGPQAVGQAILNHLPQSEMIESCSVAGPGFVNIVLSKKWIAQRLERLLIDGIDKWAPRLPVKTVLVDFSSPNIAKEMHVGHLRSTIIGDTLARMFEFSRVETLIRRNHLGDWGTQFGMLIAHLFDTYPNPEDFNEAAIGDLQAFYKASKVRFDNDPEFKLRAQQSVVRLQSGEEKYHRAWQQICDISQAEFEKVYQRLGVRLEARGESYYNDLIPQTLERLDNLGLIEEDDGARVIFVEGVNIPIIAVKRDGGYNYSSTDLAALWNRLNVENVEWNIYVTDVGQWQHFDMVFKAFRRAGWLPNHENEFPKCTHIGFGLVLGEDGKRFRTRSSETVRLVELLDEAKRRCKASLLERDAVKDWSEEEIEKTAEAVGYGAVKYADLRINRLTNYTFSFDQMLNDKYAHARICSIMRKSGKDIEEIKKNGNIVLNHEDERALGLHLIQFPEVFEESLTNLLPNVLCEYLYNLTEIFTKKFYTNCQVVGSPEETSRLLLCEATVTVMRQCFYLLGIEPSIKKQKQSTIPKQSTLTFSPQSTKPTPNIALQLTDTSPFNGGNKLPGDHCGDSGFDQRVLTAPIKSAVDKFQLIPEFLKVRGLVKQHLDSFNYFVRTDIKKIVRANNLIMASRFLNVGIGKPSMMIDEVTEGLTPQTCRLSDLTYAAPICADVEYTLRSHDKPDNKRTLRVEIGRMPIMLRSCCCVLHGKDEAELAKLGECPLDPGGYFVIKGTEKVILIQEQLSKNRIIIDTDKKGNITASVTSSTEKIKTKTVIVMENEKLWLQLNKFPKKVPLMVVMKAMGMESDQEVIQMVGRDPRYSFLLLPSIEECRKCKVYTKEQALEYLDKLEGAAFSALRDVFLANVPVDQDNFQKKCIYVAVMMRRIMDAILNKDAMDDKDYVGNKRLELSGQLISLLFEDLFKSMTTEVKNLTDKMLDKPDKAKNFDICTLLTRTRSIITLGLERTLSTGNFEIKRFRMERKGMTQVLQRLSFIGALGHMTRVSPQFEKSRKVSGPRALQPSQWGMLCPCDTPEGESCGLVKNLALMTHVTTDEEEKPLISLFYSLDVARIEHLFAEELHTPDSFLVIFNGLILGKHRRPLHFATRIRKLRRAGEIGEFVSVYVNEKQHCVYLASDGGRVCRPLVIADKGISRIKQHHMKELMDGVCTFDDFLRDGLLEYLDVNEENNALIALYEGDATSETTHIEIEPFTILGVIAGLIPYPHHNQSPRNTYQCAMGKQAMGNIAFNQLRRMDSLLYLLVYPQRPLLTTKTIELVGYDKLGAGQNATVAVMSYSGYDIEDAIVMNKASLDRGFGRCIVMKKYNAIIQKHSNDTSDRILRPNRTADTAGRMQILDDDGIAAPGEILRPYDIYINKQSPIDTRTPKTGSAANLPDSAYRSNAQSFKGNGGEVVDRVVLCSDKDNNMCIKFLIRHTRRPELGDKFSSRHGQKGVCGTIVPQEDFPFSEKGICPDLIMNPHGFPSRMTVGKMIELLGGKAGVSCGRFHYGSAFGERSGHADKVETISETLVSKGFNYSGKDFIYSGLRVGEMERDCLIAYGASMLIYERLMLSSDPFEVQVCTACGLLGYYNHKLKTGICSSCKNGDNISTMKLPYACKLMIQELQSMNIVPRLKLADA
ncbi:DNA-directed RNA polymerase III subunit 2 [Glycine soja]